jgi:hypothetical protein
MPAVAADRTTVELKQLVDDAKKRLDAGAARFRRALRGTQIGGETPLAPFKAIAAARRDALAAFGKILALDSSDESKHLALTWLSLTAAGLSAFHEALRAERLAPATSRQQHQLAHVRFTNARKTFLDLDRALGCPYGCRN